MREKNNFKLKKLFAVGMFFIFFCMLFSVVTTPNVKAVTTNLEDWDSYGIGSTSGSNGRVSWELVSAPFITVLNYPHSSPASLYTKGDGVTDGQGWINKSYNPLYETSITIYFTTWSQTIPDAGVCAMNESITFKSKNGASLCSFMLYRNWAQFEIWAQGSTGVKLYSYDLGGFGTTGFNGSINIQHKNLNLMTATLYNTTGGLISSGDFALWTMATWKNFSNIKITHAKSGPNYVVLETLIDDIFITSTGATLPSDTGKKLNFNFYDVETGKQLYFLSNDHFGETYPDDDYVAGDIESVGMHHRTRHLWPGAYSINSYPDLTATFDVTSYERRPYVIILTNLHGRVNGIEKEWLNRSRSIVFHNNSIVTITLFPSTTNFDDYYTNQGYYTYLGEKSYVGFNKVNYSRPNSGPAEEVLYRYKVPTIDDLRKHGSYTGDYYLYFKRDMGFDLWPGPDDYAGRFKIKCVMSGEWEYGSWTPVVTTDNWDEYTPFISSMGSFLNPATYLFDGRVGHPDPLHFYTFNEVFIPSGNITNIYPNPANVSDHVLVYFNANTNYYLRITDAYNNTVYRGSGPTPAGIQHIDFSPRAEGVYYVELFIARTAFSPLGSILADTASFYVGNAGYNTTAEYLVVSPSRVVTGPNDAVTIVFNTLKSDTLIKIVDARGQRSYFSRTVQPSNHKILFSLDPGAAVGVWNVTMIGNETLYSSFNVIAEYGNWVDFRKGSAYTYEANALSLYITHTEEVELLIFKDNIPWGGYIHLAAGEQNTGMLTLARRTAENMPQWAGSYTVEMWKVKNGYRTKLLSTTSTRIIYGEMPSDAGMTGRIFNLDVLGYIDNLPVLIRVGAGMGLCLVITMAPLIVGIYLSQHTQLQKLNIPPVVYLGMFVLGQVIAVLCHFLPFYVPVITMITIVLGFIVLWLRKPAPESES